MTGKKKYTGALAKPVEVEFPARPNLLISGAGAEKAYRQNVRDIEASIARERDKRWGLLRAFHGIAPECSWQDVAETLAMMHVPGMRVRKRVRVGAKLRWTQQELQRLRTMVDDARSIGGTRGDLKKALKKVATEIEWPGELSTLRSRYYESRGSAKQYGNTKE